jgi:alpha-galactosidase/6-phospho-beta-glucosidase family protein
LYRSIRKVFYPDTFNVLKNRSNSRIKFESTFTSTTRDTQTQFTPKLKDRFSNNRKTAKSSQNEKLWRHNRHSSYCSITFETKKMKRWYFFWSIRESKNTIYWLFKNFDATSAYRRRITRSTSIFIYCIKNQKMRSRVFTSTSN